MKLLTDHWSPTRVLFPRCKLTSYPPGAFFTLARLSMTRLYEYYRMYWLKINSYAHLSRGGVYDCPRSDCGAIFPDKSQWDQRLSEAAHDQLKWSVEYRLPEFEFFVRAPEAVKAVLKERQERVDAAEWHEALTKEKLHVDWCKSGLEKRCWFTKQFTVQFKEVQLGGRPEIPDGTYPWHRQFDYYLLNI
jgi:hypothetical protein